MLINPISNNPIDFLSITFFLGELFSKQCVMSFEIILSNFPLNITDEFLIHNELIT